MRRMLLAVLLAGFAVVVNQLPAHACSCVTATMTKHAATADVVFTGKVTGIERTGTTASYAVSVETVYKGQVRAETTVESPAQGDSCGLENMVADRRYLFFGGGDGTTVVGANLCGGTVPVSATSTAAIVRILGEGSEPLGATPTAAPAPVITRADLAEPTSLSRLAAPGFALVIVGLLGLLLLRRVGSARS